jgi:antitoxin HicB
MMNFSPTEAQAFIYPASLEHLDGEVIVRFPEFPEVLTGAATETEALTEAEDALEEAVLARLANGEEVPFPPSAMPAGSVGVMLAPLTAARALVDQMRRANRLTKVELAARMGRDEKVVRRVLDGRKGVSMDTVLDALSALGFKTTLAWR